jgi:penicillin G amidase
MAPSQWYSNEPGTSALFLPASRRYLRHCDGRTSSTRLSERQRAALRTLLMTTLTRRIFLWLLLSISPAFAGPKADHGNIELLRDTWGVPHVFSDTDAGAMYGLGYATAEDRGLQMTYNLRVIQGRLSEIIGEVRMLNRNETSIDHDRKMRTFSFYRGAQRTVANLDPETLTLLEAYCEGVNASFAAQKAAGTLHPLFARLELAPEPWTPADCLAVWWHVAQFFATDGTRDLIARRTRDQPAPDRAARDQAGARDSGPRDAGRGGPILPADVAPLPPDEAPSVVKRGDVSEEWIKALERYAQARGLRVAEGGAAGPSFSHAWVVGGKRTTTGSSVLVSDPQTPVRNPSLFYQFHIQGKTFNARGMGVPGNPAFLIGFSEHVAWGVTAMGADQADLFLLETDLARPDQYQFDGEWQPMTVHREEIHVKGRESIPFVVRETRLGPVATPFAFARPDEGEVALKRVPVCEEDRDTIQGAIAMIRARNAREFNAALEGWRFPSANIVFGDREGTIGYKALAAIPVRSRLDPDFGRIAMPGHSSDQDWQEILPYDLLPQVMNPAAGFIYSGNHRAIESWYPIPIFGMTGSGGDTVRSWRLRERLEARDRFTPEEVLDIHYDSVNPARRDIVRIGLHLRDIVGHEFTDEARDALACLEPWYRAGASSALTSKGAEVAVELNTFFRVTSTDLALVYGGGESGLSYFLKTATARLNTNPQAEVSPAERHFIDQSLAGAWSSARQKHGPDPNAWNAKAREAVEQRKLGYMESLDGFPSLDPNLDLTFPPLTVTDGGTITSQASQSYTQWAPMHDPDQALAILPIGQSERPDSPFRASTMRLWSQGRLHPAPLSREKVETITLSRQRLDNSQHREVGGGRSPLR